MDDNGNGTAWRSSEDPLVRLAYETVDHYVREGRLPRAPSLPGGLPERAGCFVTLHIHANGELRGCIGTIEPTRKSLAEEVIQNAVSACSRDPRFPPVAAAELDGIEISVDVLFAAEPARMEDLDPKRYGVIVEDGFRRGLLLPDLEGVDTAEQQVDIARRKAGIPSGADYRLERFEVVRHT